MPPQSYLVPLKTSNPDSNSMLDPRKDQRTDLRHRRCPFAAAGTCPAAVVLAGSTCPVVAGHTGQVVVDRTGPAVGRSPGLVAGMGWASRSCWVLVGCSSLVDPRRTPAGVAGGAGTKAVRPAKVSVVVRCRTMWDGMRCGAATC
jgi:hypothetical protein